MNGATDGHSDLVAYLHALLPFLGDQDLGHVVAKSSVVKYASRSAVTEYGEEDLSLHVVLEGSITVLPRGSERVANPVLVGAGSSLGLKSFLTGSPGSCPGPRRWPCAPLAALAIGATVDGRLYRLIHR